MSRVTRWDTTGLWSQEIVIEACGDVYTLDGDGLPRPVECILANLGILGDAELVIEFRSKGYSDPGQSYGDPDSCYAPEGSDERTLRRAYIRQAGNDTPIPEPAASRIFDALEGEINAVELEEDNE